MLVNLFKTKTPLAIFSFPLLIALLGLQVFVNRGSVYLAVYEWQKVLFEWSNQLLWLHYLLTVVVIYMSGLELNRVVNNYGFYSKNTYLPGLVYGFALSTFDQFSFSIATLAYGFLIFGLGYLLRINRQDSAISHVFKASIFFGAAGVINPFVAPIIILPWLVLLVFRSFIWREWIMALIGFALPWLYYYVVYFFFSGSFIIPFNWKSELDMNQGLGWERITLYGFAIIMTAFSVWQFMVIANNQLLIFKKRSRALFHFSWLMIIAIALGWLVGNSLVLGILVPLSIVAAVQMLYAKKNMTFNVVFAVWITLIVIERLA